MVGKTVRPKTMGARQKYPRMEERFVPFARGASHRNEFYCESRVIEIPSVSTVLFSRTRRNQDGIFGRLAIIGVGVVERIVKTSALLAGCR